MSKPVRPYGNWPSPISPESVARGSVRFSDLRIDGDNAFWIESRPAEEGRCVVVCEDVKGTVTDVLPAPYSARTRVHEYGGGALTVHNGVIYFANGADGQLYCMTVGGPVRQITAIPTMRFADMIVDERHQRLITIVEDHSTNDVTNSIAAVSLSDGNVTTLIAGNDFYSTPRLSPDGKTIAWTTWNHPLMPWDGCTLFVAPLDDSGGVGEPLQVAGSDTESIYQPEWSPEGVLHFVSDRTGWWNLYSWKSGVTTAIAPMNAECGRPQWVFGTSTYAFLNSNRIAMAIIEQGESHLIVIDTSSVRTTRVNVPFTDGGMGRYIRTRGNDIVCDAASPTESTAIVCIDAASSTDLEKPTVRTLACSSGSSLDPSWISRYTTVAFPSANGRTAYGFFYSPTNPDVDAPADERPPLLVHVHGGPTSSARSSFDMGVQYWTSRGIAILDVNHGGSTGYGRAYRESLRGQWGVVDLEDCVAAAQYLAREGVVDPQRLLISGGSAGGYTTLCALTFGTTFASGTSYYGVADLGLLARETHKFESHYLDSLIAPYPEREDIYRDRSPLSHLDKLSRPLLLLQGSDDAIVPPNQAELMFTALKQRGVSCAYLKFDGEQHGFRQADNIARALEAELYFYSKVLGFELHDSIEPIVIENLPS